MPQTLTLSNQNSKLCRLHVSNSLAISLTIAISNRWIPRTICYYREWRVDVTENGPMHFIRGLSGGMSGDLFAQHGSARPPARRDLCPWRAPCCDAKQRGLYITKAWLRRLEPVLNDGQWAEANTIVPFSYYTPLVRNVPFSVIDVLGRVHSR